MESNFSRDLNPWVRAAQRMLGHGLLLIPNEEPKDHNLYAVEEHPGLQLKVYYDAKVQFLWRGRPVPTKLNQELDRRLMRKFPIEAPLAWVAMTRTAVEEALEFARDLK